MYQIFHLLDLLIFLFLFSFVWFSFLNAELFSYHLCLLHCKTNLGRDHRITLVFDVVTNSYLLGCCWCWILSDHIGKWDLDQPHEDMGRPASALIEWSVQYSAWASTNNYCKKKFFYPYLPFTEDTNLHKMTYEIKN